MKMILLKSTKVLLMGGDIAMTSATSPAESEPNAIILSAYRVACTWSALMCIYHTS